MINAQLNTEELLKHWNLCVDRLYSRVIASSDYSFSAHPSGSSWQRVYIIGSGETSELRIEVVDVTHPFN